MGLNISFSKEIDNNALDKAKNICMNYGYDFKLVNTLIGDGITGFIYININDKIVYYTRWAFKASSNYSLDIIKRTLAIRNK